MSAEIPRRVLSDAFQEHMDGRRLVSALFTTFRFDPEFFETEILPVFFDVALSHAGRIKRVQLDDTLRSLSGSIAVYYDRNGLVPDGGPAKLDIRRFPVKHPTGIFHPKNVFALVEDTESDEEGHRSRTLLVACMSANLTRAGWWRNVEVAHIVEMAEGEHTSIGKPLLDYVNALVAAVEGQRANEGLLRARHGAAADIAAFLRGTTQREHRSVDGHLVPQFHDGNDSLPDFLANAAGGALAGLHLEIISPYLDEADASAPLEALIGRFGPPKVRVFLPRNDRNEACCTPELYEWLQSRKNIKWGSLPEKLLSAGKGNDVKKRAVHAKVYRFFDPVRGGRELLYIGSTNLTTPGCRIAGKGGNWETGFLVEVTRGDRPDWWMDEVLRRPPGFLPAAEDEGVATDGGTSLILRYRWDTQTASALWASGHPSPALVVRHGGVGVLEVAGLPPRTWTDLPRDASLALEKTLLSTSLLEVFGDGPKPGWLLVQEEGMAQRPSLLGELTIAEILKYWSLLSVEQRAAFLEARIVSTGEDDALVTRLRPLAAEPTLFDRFAGIFHAFACLERHVRDALEDGRQREADYRLFGRKYDSLGTLIDRVLSEIDAGTGDVVDQYVVVLCARQTVRELARAFPDYWHEHRDDAHAIETRLVSAEKVRAALAATDPAEMPAFLDWFDTWFLRRAEPLLAEEVES